MWGSTVYGWPVGDVGTVGGVGTLLLPHLHTSRVPVLSHPVPFRACHGECPGPPRPPVAASHPSSAHSTSIYPVIPVIPVSLFFFSLLVVVIRSENSAGRARGPSVSAPARCPSPVASCSTTASQTPVRRGPPPRPPVPRLLTPCALRKRHGHNTHGTYVESRYIGPG